MSWLFIGPRLLAGIGQVTKQYADLLGAEYVEMGQAPKCAMYAKGFAFVLPIEVQLNQVAEYAKLCREMYYMTVCETEPVNPVYSLLERYAEVLVPSEFAKQILSKQFPKISWRVLHHWTAEKPHRCPVSGPYVFYTIGNVADPRKNIRGLISAYLRCDFRDTAHLLLKATCLQSIDWKVPGVTVINGLLENEEMEEIHASAHCYVNCSHSEGVGMGAVEAAMRSKPVIITEFGGLKEYVRTPWIVKCSQAPIGFHDFLYTPELTWGSPDSGDLQRCLADCFEKKVTYWDHAHTRDLMDRVKQDLLNL
jgi:glycosyltransferase involved in cell wall biosynthesis